MRKITLNLYEQELPPKNINDLWVDIDENTGDIKAIHRYNKKESKWEPYLVSVSYLEDEKPSSPETPGEDEEDEE